jgi:BTB/POZ domain
MCIISNFFSPFNDSLARQKELEFLNPETLINLNVGGQLFETSVDILTRDPYSILAACCRRTPFFKLCSDGKTYFFDRDWWIFRHILTYLRSAILPNELETLKELYKEASFYRLESLQRSIEEIPLNQISNLSHHINPGIENSFGYTNPSHYRPR